jgi:hypothetical protein
MKRIKVSLLDELYYWLYFYSSKIDKYIDIDELPESSPLKIYATGALFMGLTMINFLFGWDVIEYILKSIGYTFNKSDGDSFFLTVLLSLWLVFYIFYFDLKADSIIAKCDKLPPQRRIRGKIKFWIYIVLTIVSIWYFDKFFH